MTTFAVTNSNQLLPAVNYLLSNLDTTGGQGNVVIPGNVLVANTTTGVVSQSGNATVFGYLYQYVNLRYSNNATGTAGFDTNSNNYSYFGVHNSSIPTPSANPSAYQWYEVSPPFDTATSRTLYYSAIGGRQIQWAAASAPPNPGFLVTVANVAIDLDVVTTATGTSGERGPLGMAYVITTANPGNASSSTLTGWFEASRTANTPPIGTGLAPPVVGDTAYFTYPTTGQSSTFSYNGSVWNSVVGQVVSGDTLVANSVPGSSLANDTVTAGKIANATITGDKISGNTITGNLIQANTITGNNIAANTITGNRIAAQTISGTNIVGNTITSDLIAASTITGDKIAGNTITANNITVGTLTTNLFTANTINASIIQANTFSANTISGQAIDSGTITTDKLAANILVANTVVSTGATLGNINSPGFWLDGNTGNARFGNTVSIGNSLTVGNNATIGGNLVISGLVSSGNLISNVVQTNNIVTFSVTNTVFADANPDPTLIIYTNNANLYPNNTRGQAVPNGIAILPTTTSDTQGSKILVNYQTYLSSAANSQYNLVELWKETVSYSSQYNFNNIYVGYPMGNVNPASSDQNPIIVTGTNGGVVYTAGAGDSGGWTNASNASITNNWSGGQIYASAVDTPGGGENQTYTLNLFDANGVFFARTATANNFTALSTAMTINTTFNNGTGSTINDAILLTGGSTTTPYMSQNLQPQLYVGNAGRIYRSSRWQTGNTWGGNVTAETSNVVTDLNAVSVDRAPGVPPTSTTLNVVAVGAQGTIVTNSRVINGTNGTLISTTGWSSRISGTVQNLNGVVYNGVDTWMAVGNQGTVLTSATATGATWTQKPSPTPTNLNDVTFYAGQSSPFVNYWIAVGNGGTILVSTDVGTTWTTVANPASNGSLGFVRNLNAVTVNNYVAFTDYAYAAGEGVILRSQAPFTTWETVYDAGFVQNPDLQRVEYYGSYANVFTTTEPSTIQRLGNNQVIAGTFIDSTFTANIPVKYYLYAGSLLANSAVYVQGSTLTATEFKR
jgi:hypothetical protein